jgi:elongation factor G
MPLSVTGHGKYAKQAGGRGQYGHVVLLLTLHDADTGVSVMNRLAAGEIPVHFHQAIEQGIRFFLAEGWLAKRGYSGGFIEVVNASWHETDSSKFAFYTAAVMAMDDALRQLPCRWESAEGDDAPGVRELRPPYRSPPASSIAVPEPRDDH